MFKKYYYVLLFISLFALTGCMNEKDVQEFYQKAGFKGTITNFDTTAQVHKAEFIYTYKEKIGNKLVSIDFSPIGNIGEDDKPENFDSQEELAGQFSHELIEPLIIGTFEQSEAFQQLSESIKTAFNQVGLKTKNVSVDNPISNLDSIVTELTKDLAGKERTPLRGIASLDVSKYLKRNLYHVEISLESPIPGFDMSQLSTEGLIDGTYEVFVPHEDYPDSVTGYFSFVVQEGQIVTFSDETAS